MTSKNVCDILQILALGMLVCEVTCFMTTFQDVSEIKYKCFVDDCDWQKYCDHQSMRCERCSDRFLQCFTPKQDPNCTVFCMINRACPALGGLEHGDHNGTGRQFLLNEKVTFRCESGYHNTGVKETVCLSYGLWSHQQLGIKQPHCDSQQTFNWIVVVLAVVCVILLVALVTACLKLNHSKEHSEYKKVDSNEADDKDVENAMEKWKLKDAQDAEQRTDSIENGPSYSLRQKQAKAVPPTTTEKTITEKTDDNDRMMSGQSTSNHQAPPVYNIYSPDTVNIGNGNNKIMPGSVLFGEDESPQSDNLNTCNTPAGEETGTSHKAQHDGEDAPFISQESNPGASSENYVKDLHV